MEFRSFSEDRGGARTARSYCPLTKQLLLAAIVKASALLLSRRPAAAFSLPLVVAAGWRILVRPCAAAELQVVRGLHELPPSSLARTVKLQGQHLSVLSEVPVRRVDRQVSRRRNRTRLQRVGGG